MRAASTCCAACCDAPCATAARCWVSGVAAPRCLALHGPVPWPRLSPAGPPARSLPHHCRPPVRRRQGGLLQPAGGRGVRPDGRRVPRAGESAAAPRHGESCAAPWRWVLLHLGHACRAAWWLGAELEGQPSSPRLARRAARLPACLLACVPACRSRAARTSAPSLLTRRPPSRAPWSRAWSRCGGHALGVACAAFFVGRQERAGTQS